jgi:hypothetical protein
MALDYGYWKGSMIYFLPILYWLRMNDSTQDDWFNFAWQIFPFSLKKGWIQQVTSKERTWVFSERGSHDLYAIYSNSDLPVVRWKSFWLFLSEVYDDDYYDYK